MVEMPEVGKAKDGKGSDDEKSVEKCRQRRMILTLILATAGEGQKRNVKRRYFQ